MKSPQNHKKEFAIMLTSNYINELFDLKDIILEDINTLRFS